MHSLYIHIPFCLKRCIYCDFVSTIYDDSKASAYVEALKHEISGITKKSSLATLFIGGGTPTAISTELLSGFFKHVFDHFKFNDNYEASIEANPCTLNPEKLLTIHDAGINRISMGVQSFNSNELSFLSRIHSSHEAEHAIHMAKEAGFNNVGIDLIYGIPGQSLESWKKTLEKTVSLKPEHISTYELTVETGTELDGLLNAKQCPSKERPLSTPVLLSDEMIVEMYEYAIYYLTSQGFIHYEISNFARPGYECRHNLNYWDRGEYIGAGLGAHSFLHGKRFHNTDSLDRYLTSVQNNATAVENSEDITCDSALSEAIFLGLRKIGGINIESLSRRYNVNILSSYGSEIKELSEAGLIELTTSNCSYETDLKLTSKGLVLSNEVFLKFI